MANSPSICQEAVATALKPYLDKGLNIYHYIDDILVWGTLLPPLPNIRTSEYLPYLL